jgi:GLPGLI family protein
MFVSNFSQAQDKSQGIISYDRTLDYYKLSASLNYMSKEELDRLKMTYKEPYTEKYTLYFGKDQSLFTYDEDDNSNATTYKYAWRQSDFKIYRNYADQTKQELIEMLGKIYVLEDTLQSPNWKIMNQVKNIAGYVCMKAIAQDTITKQNITAWFCDGIATSAGPERLYGLPGAILELDINEGTLVVKAQKIVFKPLDEQLKIGKIKGKKITEKQYNDLIIKHIADSVKAQRNPFWTIRY